MASLAPTHFLADAEAPSRPLQLRPVEADTAAGGEDFVRSVYQPSRRSGPVAGLASAGVLLAALAALATLGVAAQHKASSRLTVVAMQELKTTPPPPPPKSLDKPVVQPPQAFVPKPMIALPAPGPTQVAVDTPPPPAPPVTTVTQRVAAPAGPAAAAPAPASDPVEGGDLSSQVLSAKPPSYPIDARRQREQGTVKLLVLVGPDGRVADIRLATSSGSSRLDRAALDAVKRWRWVPQKKAGAAVAVRGYVTIPFVLTT